MEKEIGSETEMEEGTGGRREGRRGRKGGNVVEVGNRTGSARVSLHPLVIYCSLQSSRKNHYSGRHNHGDPPLLPPT